MSYRFGISIIVGVVSLTVAACVGASSAPQTAQSGGQTQPSVAEAAFEGSGQPGPSTAPAAVQPGDGPSDGPASGPVPPMSGPADATGDSGAVDVGPPPFLARGWKTDFSRHSVPYDEIMSGGPRRDGIPPIDNPVFISAAAPPDYMRDNEPVIALEINDEAKAYPLAILMSHEIVNDEIGGVPVSVTYCPLCNTSIVFDRRVNGQVLDFGTSGNLRNSDLVMWDRQTESWWQQITGEAIVGELTGTRLSFIPAPVVSWRDFREAFPEGAVLSRDTGFHRGYDRPPYRGYDELDRIPFLFSGAIDPRLRPMERVVGLSVGEMHMAYPFLVLEQHPVVNDTLSGKDVVVFYVGGTLSPFAKFGGSAPERPVGSTAVYEPFVDGQKLMFEVRDNVIIDAETGSKWDILGRAVEGPLAGSRLAPVVHGNHFWFAWAAFHRDTDVKIETDLGG